MHTILSRKLTLFIRLSSSMAAPSPSFLHNSRLNPATHSTIFLLNIPQPLSFHHHRRRRSFKVTPVLSTSKHQPPPSDIKQEPTLPLPSTEKRSFAVATGELFLGIASRLIRGRRRIIPLSGDDSESGERIAVVIEDSVEPEVLWEQRVKDVEAEEPRKMVTSPGFSFSAAGLLFPYHLGVAQFLTDNGYIKETTPLAGSSAGAIVCAVIASGSCMQVALGATKVLAADCRLKGTAFRLGAVLRDVLDKILPDDIHTRCNGRVRVAVTQIAWRPRGLLIDQFDSREDLIDALITSSFIPGYLAPRPATIYRNRVCIDGGLTLFMPQTSASQTVRVCAFSASSLRMQGIGISPDCVPESRHTLRQLVNWALEPADDSMLDKLFEFGYLDASIWAKENPVDSVVQEDTL